MKLWDDQPVATSAEPAPRPPSRLPARRREPADGSGYGPTRWLWLSAQGEGKEPGRALVLGGQRLAWLATILRRR